MPIKFVNLEIQTDITFQQIPHIRKTKADHSPKQKLTEEKKVTVNVVWDLIPPDISCSAPSSIYRIVTRYRFQICSPSLCKEIRTKTIEDLKKESNKHRMAGPRLFAAALFGANILCFLLTHTQSPNPKQVNCQRAPNWRRNDLCRKHTATK